MNYSEVDITYVSSSIRSRMEINQRPMENVLLSFMYLQKEENSGNNMTRKDALMANETSSEIDN